MIDPDTAGNIRIYDLLLHKRDVSYSVPNLIKWLERSSIHFIDFSLASSRIVLSLSLKIVEKLLYSQLTKFSATKQSSIAEIIEGHHYKQEFYASTFAKAEASPHMHNITLYAYGLPAGFQNTISDQRNYFQLRNETYIYAQLNRKTTFAWPSNKFNNFAFVSLTSEHFKPKTVSKIISKYATAFNSSLTIKQLQKSFENFYSYAKVTGLFLLKRQSVGIFPKTCCFNQFAVGGISLPDSLLMWYNTLIT